jgi:hypothetical protein
MGHHKGRSHLIEGSEEEKFMLIVSNLKRTLSTSSARVAALAAIASVFAASQYASAAPVQGGAYEPFDYANGTQLIVGNNLNGGAGWNATGDVNAPNAATSRWADPTALPAAGGSGPAKQVFTPGLNYSALGYPTTTGGKATIDARIVSPAAPAGQTNNVSRHMGQLVDSGPFYFSYLTDKNNDTMRTTTLTFFGPANGVAGTPGNQPERLAIGQIGTGTATNAMHNGNLGLYFNNAQPGGVVSAANPIPYGVDVTHLIIGKVDWNPLGNETVTLWVDPLNVTSEAAAGTPYLVNSNFELTSFNSIRLFAGNEAAAVGAPHNHAVKPPVSADFDEIRFGSSWDAAITTNVVPEPATLLLPLAGLALLSTRRRRA